MTDTDKGRDFTAPSLMRMSAAARLVLALGLVALVWLIVVWAVR
jgi:hypothetical protein